MTTITVQKEHFEPKHRIDCDPSCVKKPKLNPSNQNWYGLDYTNTQFQFTCLKISHNKFVYKVNTLYLVGKKSRDK